MKEGLNISIRKDLVSFSLDSESDLCENLLVTEWWNGEGVCVEAHQERSMEKMDISFEGLEALFAGLLAAELIDLDEVMERKKELEARVAANRKFAAF